MPEQGLTKNAILTELSRSAHGKLEEYLPVGRRAATEEPEFFAHLIAWDRLKGQIRDSKVALPVISLTVKQDAEFDENALAHLALLGPREFLRAFHFALDVKPAGKMSRLRRLVGEYLRSKEQDHREWDRLAIQHRNTLLDLYAIAHVKPGKHAQNILFDHKFPKGSAFEAVAQLKTMAPAEAAAAITKFEIPFLIAHGSLGKKATEPDLLLALIQRMTPSELTANMKNLEKLGVKQHAATRGALEEALSKAAGSKKNSFKASKAVDYVEDEGLKDKLRALQDKQVQSIGIEGNWLVLADKSKSMEQAIEVSKHVAATLAGMVKGKVWLVFFDTSPMSIDVSGAPLDVIQKATRHITANGGTSIGCGLKRMLDEKAEFDGIAIVSDAEENEAPRFAKVHAEYCQFVGKDVPVYLYECKGYGHAKTLKHDMAAGAGMQVFEIPPNIDYYSLPNMIQTMRTNRYSLLDEVMAVPLLELGAVLKLEEHAVA